MEISLKNHEDRIAALENKIGTGGGIVESSLTNPGYVKFANGLIMNFGYTKSTVGINGRQVSFAKTHTVIPSFLVSMRSGGSGESQFNSFYVYNLSTSNASFRNNARENSSMSWFTIGYLISYRILKYMSKFLNSVKNLKAVI